MIKYDVIGSNAYVSIESALWGNQWEKRKSTGGCFVYLSVVDM